MQTEASDALAAYGPWGLIGFVVLAVLRGWLLPASVVRDLRAELEYTRARNQVLQDQRNIALIEVAKVATALAKLPIEVTATEEAVR
jgi:hypothetical protein